MIIFRYLAKEVLTLRILAGAFVWSCLILAAIPWLLFPGELNFNLDLSRPMALVVTIISIVILFSSSFIENKVHRAVKTTSSGKGEMRSVLGFVIGFVLRELVAVLGFILSVQNQDPNWATIFGGVAMLALLHRWPTERRVRETRDRRS